MGNQRGKKHQTRVKYVKDFEKTKKKVGKKLQPANVTKIEFKSRGINIPSQMANALRNDKDVQAMEDGSSSSSMREPRYNGLTCQDLTVRVGHYNASMRLEALRGIISVSKSHAAYFVSSSAVLLAMMEKIAPRISDESPQVRETLRVALTVLFQELGENVLAPYFPLLVIHTCSAMTNLNPDIKSDSLRFVDVWLELAPSLLIKHGSRIFSNFIDLISLQRSSITGENMKGPGDHSSSSSKRIITVDLSSAMSSLQGRIKVLQRLLKFVRLAYGDNESEAEDEEEDGGEDTETGGEGEPTVPWQHLTQEHLLRKTSSDTMAFALMDLADNLPQLFSFESLLRFFSQDLLPVLWESWLELSPTQLTPETATHQLVENLSIILTLFKVFVDRLLAIAKHTVVPNSKWLDPVINVLMKHLAPCFPLGGEIISLGGPLYQELIEMNLFMANISISLSSYLPQKSNLMLSVKEYLMVLIGSFKPQRKSKKIEILSVLGDLLSLLKSVVDQGGKETFTFFPPLIELYESMPFGESAKHAILRFLIDTYEIFLDGRQPRNAECQALFSVFTTSLPRYLWELGVSNADLSGSILRTLLHMGAIGVVTDPHTTAQSPPPSSSPPPLLDKLLPKLAMLLQTTTTKGQRLFGPFIHLSETLQILYLQLLYYATTVPENMYVALTHCCMTSSLPENVFTTCVDVLAMRATRCMEQTEKPFVLNMVFSLILGYPSGFFVEREHAKAHSFCGQKFYRETFINEAKGGVLASSTPRSVNLEGFWKRRFHLLKALLASLRCVLPSPFEVFGVGMELLSFTETQVCPMDTLVVALLLVGAFLPCEFSEEESISVARTILKVLCSDIMTCVDVSPPAQYVLETIADVLMSHPPMLTFVLQVLTTDVELRQSDMLFSSLMQGFVALLGTPLMSSTWHEFADPLLSLRASLKGTSVFHSVNAKMASALRRPDLFHS